MMPHLTWRLWALLIAAAGLLGWYVVPPDEPDAPLVRPRRDVWQMPMTPRAADQTALAGLLNTAGFWGSGPVQAVAPPPEPQWRVAAVYGRGKEGGVLILWDTPAKEPLKLKTGDKLPNGDRIVRIDEREFQVKQGKKTVTLGVERSEP